MKSAPIDPIQIKDRSLFQRRIDLMRRSYAILALTIFFCSLIAPALSIDVGFSSERSGQTASSSASYDLDASTRLGEAAKIGDGDVIRAITASGSGENSISVSSTAKGKSTGSKMDSSGDFRTTAFAGVSKNGAIIDQDTSIHGSSGELAYYADSPENRMLISAGFDSQGDLSARVFAGAAKRASMSGDIEALGVKMLDSESMQIVGSGDISMAVNGLSNDGQGGFGLIASNAKKGIGSDLSQELIGPQMTASGGRASAYTLLGYRWNTRDPQIKWILKNDNIMKNEGLQTAEVKRAIEAASNTWDAASNQNLFADSNLVTLDPLMAADRYDRKNVINWKPFATNCNALAYARTYYSSAKVDGYNSALESDLVLNSNYNWRTDSTNKRDIDVQSVLLHEMGHTLGLGDLYNKMEFAYDTGQVMHCYSGEKRSLGNGDKAGIWRLYR
jgi:hypothetical protein